MAKSKDEITDSLSDIISKALNSKHKTDAGKVAYFLDRDLDAPTVVKEWISTGCTALDFIISNRKNGGFPVGKISEITGIEQSGKSLLAAHALATTQKRGGIAVYIDTESAVDPNFLRAIGIDLSNLVYVPCETIEEVFDYMETVIEKARQSSKDQLVTIVVDSIAGASTNQELASDFSKEGYNTSKAQILGKAMRKITNLIADQRICLIFTNQLRVKMDAMAFGDKYQAPGGKAVPFHASVRLRLASTGTIKGELNGKDEKIGAKTKVKVVKNRLGPPQRECEYSIYFNSGIDDASGWVSLLKEYKILKTAGAYLKGKLANGDEITLQAGEFREKILNDEENRQYFYDQLADLMIMPYEAHVGETVDEPDVEYEE